MVSRRGPGVRMGGRSRGEDAEERTGDEWKEAILEKC